MIILDVAETTPCGFQFAAMLIASLSDLDDQGVARRRTRSRLDGADVLAQNRYGLGETLTLQSIQIF